MKKQQEAKAFFAPIYSRAAHDYVCDGCLGEYAIQKGDYIMKLKTMTTDGKFETMVLCARCKLAVQAKFAHNGHERVSLEKGSLKFQMLSSAFKKAWGNMEKTMIELHHKGELTHELQISIVKEMIRTVAGDEAVDREKFERNIREAIRTKRENRRKLKSMREAFDEAKKELEAVRKRDKTISEKVTELCTRLATDRLGLFQAKTDEERQEWKGVFIDDLNEMRNLAGELVEQDKD